MEALNSAALKHSASFNSFRALGCGVEWPQIDPEIASCNNWSLFLNIESSASLRVTPHERLSE